MDNKINNAIDNRLPTAKEYCEMANQINFSARWSEPKYQCPKCNGGMRRDKTIVLNSFPVQYMYECDKCGYRESQYI